MQQAVDAGTIRWALEAVSCQLRELLPGSLSGPKGKGRFISGEKRSGNLPCPNWAPFTSSSCRCAHKGERQP